VKKGGISGSGHLPAKAGSGLEVLNVLAALTMRLLFFRSRAASTVLAESIQDRRDDIRRSRASPRRDPAS